MGDCFKHGRGAARMLRVLLVTAALVAVGLAETCRVSSSECGFYKCLERKYQCDTKMSSYFNRGNRYPMHYGYKYCEKFKTITGKMSEKGLRFIDNTRRCLQQALLSWSDRNPNGDCKALTNTAFDSHPRCYTGHSASICYLSPREMATVATVVDASDLFSFHTVKQAGQTAAICARQLSVSVPRPPPYWPAAPSVAWATCAGGLARWSTVSGTSAVSPLR